MMQWIILGIFYFGTVSLTVVLDMVAYSLKFQKRELAFEREREQWAEERKDLISRIQSQSYTEYAVGQAKMAKAQKPEEEKKPFEFV